MADNKQMCLACNTQPAVTGGPVPLCSRCSAQAKQNDRGVKFEKDAAPSPEPVEACHSSR